jgi:hypothetical protein
VNRNRKLAPSTQPLSSNQNIIQEDRRMSHIVSIETKVHDPAAVGAACTRLGLAAPVEGTARLYSGEATGLIVQFPDWRFPTVIDTVSGKIQFDNYRGHWGEQQHLDRFLQMYSVEKAKLEARKKGFAVNEQALQDGSIKLQITEGS